MNEAIDEIVVRLLGSRPMMPRNTKSKTTKTPKTGAGLGARD